MKVKASIFSILFILISFFSLNIFSESVSSVKVYLINTEDKTSENEQYYELFLNCDKLLENINNCKVEKIVFNYNINAKNFINRVPSKFRKDKVEKNLKKDICIDIGLSLLSNKIISELPNTNSFSIGTASLDYLSTLLAEIYLKPELYNKKNDIGAQLSQTIDFTIIASYYSMLYYVNRLIEITGNKDKESLYPQLKQLEDFYKNYYTKLKQLEKVYKDYDLLIKALTMMDAGSIYINSLALKDSDFKKVSEEALNKIASWRTENTLNYLLQKNPQIITKFMIEDIPKMFYGNNSNEATNFLNKLTGFYLNILTIGPRATTFEAMGNYISYLLSKRVNEKETKWTLFELELFREASIIRIYSELAAYIELKRIYDVTPTPTGITDLGLKGASYNNSVDAGRKISFYSSLISIINGNSKYSLSDSLVNICKNICK